MVSRALPTSRAHDGEFLGPPIDVVCNNWFARYRERTCTVCAYACSPHVGLPLVGTHERPNNRTHLQLQTLCSSESERRRRRPMTEDGWMVWLTPAAVCVVLAAAQVGM